MSPGGASERAKPVYCWKSVGKRNAEIKRGISSVKGSSSLWVPALSHCSTSLYSTLINSNKKIKK